MAAPEAEFRPAGITVPQLTPSVYHPGNVNVPEGAGALWARAGETALAAGKAIQESPLNAAVRAQQQVQVANAQQGLAHMKWLQSLGDKAHWLQGMGADGRPYYISPAEIRDPSLAALFGYPGTPPPPSDGKGDGKGNGGNGTGESKSNTPSKPPSTEEQAKPKPQASATQSPTSLFASTNPYSQPPSPDTFYAQTGGMAPGPQGAPPGYFRNPATGSYEPLQNQPPQQAAAPPQQAPPRQPQPPQAQASDVIDKYAYAAGHAQGVEARLAQAAQSQQPQPNWAQGPGAAVAGATPSLHPVMSSGTALEWAKNFDTSTQRAVYLPQTPTGEPGFAFYGPKNKPLGPPVPISQMIRHGATGLATGENLGSALNVADQQQAAQQQQAQPPQTNQPGNMLLQQPPQPPQPAQTNQPGNMLLQPQPPAGAPPAGAPPAPGPTRIYPTIASDQGGLQGQPPPAPSPQAQLAAARQPIPGLGTYVNVPSQGGTPTQYLSADVSGATQQPAEPGQPEHGFNSPITTAAPNIPQAQQDAVQAQANKNKNVNEFTNNGMIFRRDTDKNSEGYGRLFLSLPPTAGNYYQAQRWYLGSDGYHLFDLPDAYQRQQMQYWVNHGVLTQDEVRNKSAQEMKPWLDQAWKDQNMTKTDPTGGVNRDLNAAEQFHMVMGRIKNLVISLGGGTGESSRYNVMAKIRAAVENATESLGAGGVTKDILPDFPPEAAHAIRTLEQEINTAHALLTSNPDLIMPLGKGGGQETPNVHWESVRLGAPNIPASTVLDDVFSGQPQTGILRNLDNLQKRGDLRYREMVDDAQTQWYRFNPRHSANIARFDSKQDIPDDSDSYKHHSIFFNVPGQKQPVAPGSSSTAGPSATPSVPQFRTTDDLTAWRKQKHDPGTRYQVWDSDKKKMVDFETK